jgi:GTP 3',8-cyclase
MPLPDLLTIPEVHSGPTAEILYDTLARPLQYLRISLSDQCNFRCPYCLPENCKKTLPAKKSLTPSEIIRVSKICSRIGVTKIRLTGGEPLLRRDLLDIVAGIAAIPKINDLALTTNGLLLNSKAKDLAQAGLKRITISLNTLDHKIFKQMSGGKGELDEVLAGISAAQAAGLNPIKINTVIQKGVNEQGVLELVQHFMGTGVIVRFIEYMDVGNCNHWQESEVVPSSEILQQIQKHFPLEPVKDNPSAMPPAAKNFRFVDGSGSIGFISAISEPFCSSCNRLRLSPDGKLYACLFAQHGFDLSGLLHNGGTDREISQVIQSFWTRRTDCYSNNRQLIRAVSQAKNKIEMYEIGG